MDNLRCDEEWAVMSPEVDGNGGNSKVIFNVKPEVTGMNQEDCLGTIRVFIEKEERFMPEPGYLSFLASDEFVRNARFEAISWLIKTQWRIGLAAQTIFAAINYLDRFVSKTQCRRWEGPKDKLFKLLALACLSVSSKFNNSGSPPLREFQDEEMDYPFELNLIQKMELYLLDTLGWQMDCVTPFSYVALLLQGIEVDKPSVHAEDMTSLVTNLLATASLDAQTIQFRPSIIAVSAIRCILDNLQSSSDHKFYLHQCLSSIMPQYHKDRLIKCEEIILDLHRVYHSDPSNCEHQVHGPQSPVTVLEGHNCEVCNAALGKSRKRKRAQMENWVPIN